MPPNRRRFIKYLAKLLYLEFSHQRGPLSCCPHFISSFFIPYRATLTRGEGRLLISVRLQSSPTKLAWPIPGSLDPRMLCFPAKLLV